MGASTKWCAHEENQALLIKANNSRNIITRAEPATIITQSTILRGTTLKKLLRNGA